MTRIEQAAVTLLHGKATPRAAVRSYRLFQMPSSLCCTAMKKLRIVILGFGTARQTLVLE
jgi:hypothetical protein